MEHPYMPGDLSTACFPNLPFSWSLVSILYLSGSSLGYRISYLNSNNYLCAGGFSADLNERCLKGKNTTKVTLDISRDSTILAIEVMAIAFDCPASLLAIYAIAKAKNYSYILQFAASLVQLYGVLVYYIMTHFDGYNFATSPLYYYAYCIFANSFLVVILSLIIVRSWKKIYEPLQSQSQKNNKIH